MKPINCTCGGLPKGRGRCIACSICNRVVQLPTRLEAIERWNEVILKELANLERHNET